MSWRTVDIRGEDKAFLSFERHSRTRVTITAGNANFRGEATVFDSDLAIPQLFSAMAAEWRGWEGKKHWSDDDMLVEMNCTTDSIGHTFISIALSDSDRWNELKLRVELLGSQLEGIAAQFLVNVEDPAQEAQQ